MFSSLSVTEIPDRTVPFLTAFHIGGKYTGIFANCQEKDCPKRITLLEFAVSIGFAVICGEVGK